MERISEPLCEGLVSWLQQEWTIGPSIYIRKVQQEEWQKITTIKSRAGFMHGCFGGLCICYKFRSSGKPISTQLSSPKGDQWRDLQLKLSLNPKSVILQSDIVYPHEVLSMTFIIIIIKAFYRQLSSSYLCHEHLRTMGLQALRPFDVEY